MNLVKNDILDVDAFRAWSPEYKDAEFILEDGKYICGWAIEKMSKSMYNVVNPDDIVNDYGADTLRLYEMFLGPLEASKPWDTNGIDGCFRFLKKLWSLFWENRTDNWLVNDDKPTQENLKSLHKLIKKVTQDIENFSFNTSISAAQWPKWNEEYLAENEIQLTVSFNGKARFQKMFAADASKDEIEKLTLEDDRTAKYTEGMQIMKVIVVPKKIINIVVK